MFRASSEMAVATTARSVDGNPHCDASSRPFWRAATTSVSQSMETRTSSAMSANFLIVVPPLAVEIREALFEVQRGRDAFQGEAQLDHREGHLRLDADDDGLGAAQPDHVRHVPLRPGRERAEQVPRGAVHDDVARAALVA